MHITRVWNPFGNLRIIFSWRSSKNRAGRFGGGWQWKVGFQSCSTSVIFNLLICNVAIAWYKEKEKEIT